MGSYIHLLNDKDVIGSKGQLICDHCKLESTEYLETWENFLNGEWVTEEPTQPGNYPVMLRKTSEQVLTEARTAKNNKIKCVWVDEKVRGRLVKRWSLPLPVIQNGVNP
ncbi:MAG: hypothetical protein DRJ03_06895 [Chloroflexi bacterium]|nr:MAG: hypothetical protein DRJ03_06895 [Chloroflexota bacterium]